MSGTGPLTRSRALSTNLAAIMGDVTPTSEVEALRSELADLKRQLAALTTKTPEFASSDNVAGRNHIRLATRRTRDSGVGPRDHRLARLYKSVC